MRIAAKERVVNVMAGRCRRLEGFAEGWIQKSSVCKNRRTVWLESEIGVRVGSPEKLQGLA